MNRSEALHLGYGSIAGIAGFKAVGAGCKSTPLSEFAFAVGIGSGRAVGVLFGSPEIVVEDTNGDARRLFVPRAAGEPDTWTAAVPPAKPPGTDVDSAPDNDVRYGHILDQATGLTGGEGGAYVAMWSFPADPYLVYYNVIRDRIWTRVLPPGPRVVGLFTQVGRLYFVRAGDPELRFVDLVNSAS